MKTVFAIRSANGNTDAVTYTFDLEKAVRHAYRLYDHLTDKEKETNVVTVERYDIEVPADDLRDVDSLVNDVWDSEDNVFEHDPVKVLDISKTEVNVLERFRDKIEEELVRCYRAVLESDGKIQYRVYIWDDGEIKTLEQIQGDNSYLVANPLEGRKLYHVETVSAPCFDPWDYTVDSRPDDDDEADRVRSEIIDYLVEEYETNTACEIVDDAIRNAKDFDRDDLF